jgi:hypothetical protein
MTKRMVNATKKKTWSISGPLVRCTPPAGETDINDGFVYVVSRRKGRRERGGGVTILVN